MKDFEEYIEEGVARKITPDMERSKSLLEESRRKYDSLLTNIEKLGIDDDNANDYVEYCYNIILFLIRSRMLKHGYKTSGEGAHEAEVSFSSKLGSSESEIRFLDQLRYFRNGILYYGKRFDKEYALMVIKFTKKIFKRLI